ncbi:MAG TPA: DinB family protein [Polyangiaceae bacterium]|jgi:uncharacterized damage-inducible protein DinB
MSSLAHHFVTMAWNNAWANHRLLGAVVRLSQGELAAKRTSFFPSIKATLNHVVTVDWYYVDALERGIRGDLPNENALREFFEPEEPFDDADALRAAQRAVDMRLVRACGSLSEADLEKPIAIVRAGGVQRESVTRLLAHLFQHQIHHRGQAHAMLAGTSVAPPQLDEFFCANEAHLRAAELAELGTSEAEIWSTE